MASLNGRLRRWQMIGAISLTVATGLSIGTAYAWPFLTAIVTHTQTIVWVSQLRYNHPTLGQDHGRLIDRLDGAAARDEEVDRLRKAMTEIKLDLGKLAATQNRMEGMLRQQEGMLRTLLQRKLEGG